MMQYNIMLLGIYIYVATGFIDYAEAREPQLTSDVGDSIHQLHSWTLQSKHVHMVRG